MTAIAYDLVQTSDRDTTPAFDPTTFWTEFRHGAATSTVCACISLSWLFRAKAMRPWTITPADLDEYVRVNAAVGATRAALSYYRHVFSPEGLEQGRARTERQLRLPILAFGADKGVGTGLVETMRLVATDVRVGVFEGCGHYVPEEAPRALADQIIKFMGV